VEAEVAPEVAKTHSTYAWTGGQAEWACINTKMVEPPTRLPILRFYAHHFSSPRFWLPIWSVYWYM